MSIYSQIKYIQNQKEAIRQTIISKGVDVPADERIGTYSLYISQIPSGKNITDIFNILYPVGIIISYADGIDLNAYFQNIIPDCKWERCLLGRSPIGLSAEDPILSMPGTQLGEKEHTLTVNEMPAHNHRLHQGGGNLGGKYTTASSFADNGWDGAYIENTGGNGAHNNLHPVEVVAFWKRTK